MQYYGILPKGRIIQDWDFISTFPEFQKWTKQNKSLISRCTPLSDSNYHVKLHNGDNYEFEIAWDGTSGYDLLQIEHREGFVDPSWQLALKLSHRYLKNSVHFLKTMKDIQYLRAIYSLTDIQQEWVKKREKETYTYKHPRLDVDKQAFFKDDGIRYVYDHDSIHLTQASYADDSGNMMPAYTFYMKDGSEVMTSKQKFFVIPEHFRVLGVYEESCVLALERSQIPYEFKPSPRKSFEKALMKVCTSITSGWFREYAWENYDKVIDLCEKRGETDYVEKFNSNKNLLKPYKS
jgi:hypothetical protein